MTKRSDFNALLFMILLGVVPCQKICGQSPITTATAAATITNGFVVAATVISAGSGYVEPPIVTITGGGGIGATAIAVITNSSLSRVIIQTAGNGYTSTPLVGISPATNTTSFLRNGLIAYYPFTGNAYDVTGNGNDGVVHGAILSTDRFGQPNSAYAFNGASSYIEMPNPLPDMVDSSFSVWIEVERFDSMLREVFFEGDPVTGTDFSLRLSTTDPTSAYSKGGGYMKIPNGLILLNKWMQVVGTFGYKSNYCALWVNGIKIATTTLGGPNRGNHYRLQIGRYSDSPSTSGGFFQGKIDDLRIYNRALSDAEVEALNGFETVQPNAPMRAMALPVVVNGFLVGARIIDGGHGYTNSPTVQIIGRGSGATATSVLSNGEVSSLAITSAGIGYDANTFVVIDAPPKSPTVAIAVKTVQLTFSVWGGKHYLVEQSVDLQNWKPVLDFVAEGDTVTRDFPVIDVGRYFRVQESL